MSELSSAIDRLLKEASEADSRNTLQPQIQAVLQLRSTATADELAEAVRTISEALDPEYAEVSGWLALTAGAIVESGAECPALASRLIECLPSIILKATAFGEFALSQALSPEESEAIEDDTRGEWIAGRFLPPEQAAMVFEQEPDGADAWVALSSWFSPAVACFTRDLPFRKRAVGALPALKRLDELSGSAHCLFVLLEVLDDEPLVVFHPSTGLGFRLRVSGVADNFQLHTLLADTLLQRPASMSWLHRFKSRLPGTPPHPIAAAVARGDGPQESDVPSQGVWDLYNWTALGPDGTLPPNVPPTHWIWGEGIPADILTFEGCRVVLLGAPSYIRTWNTARYFSALRASVVIEETLPREEARSWLRRLGQAQQPS